jgi:hypothetical protein
VQGRVGADVKQPVRRAEANSCGYEHDPSEDQEHSRADQRTPREEHGHEYCCNTQDWADAAVRSSHVANHDDLQVTCYQQSRLLATTGPWSGADRTSDDGELPGAPPTAMYERRQVDVRDQGPGSQEPSIPVGGLTMLISGSQGADDPEDWAPPGAAVVEGPRGSAISGAERLI